VAKIKALPGMEIIDGFKGTIDFYVHRGQPCARMWPRSPGRNRAPAVQAQWPAFAFPSYYWKYLSAEVKEAWNTMANGHSVTGKDLFTRAYINGTAVRLG